MSTRKEDLRIGTPDEPESTVPSRDDRLDSWKEIAAYLNRTVRTVQRWEKDRGLPVYRIPGGSRRVVSALKSEVDAWYRSTEGQEDSGAQRRAASDAGNGASLRGWYADSDWRLGIFALLLPAALVGFFWITFWDTEPRGLVSLSFADARSLPFTTLPGAELDPSFSPDGEHVAFSWDGPRQENRDIYILAVGGQNPRRLTRSPFPDEVPAWSPDGERIAFLRDIGEKVELMVRPIAAGHELTLGVFPSFKPGPKRHPFFMPPLAWTNDGAWVAASCRDSSGWGVRICLFSLATGEKRFLTHPPEGTADTQPAFSRDSRQMAFVRGRRALYRVHLSENLEPDGEPERVTPPYEATGWLRSPIWTPDGQKILFSYGGDLRQVDLRDLGRDEILVSWGENRYSARPAATISIPHQRLVFEKRVTNINIYELERDGDGTYAAPKLVIESTRGDYGPRYSPDVRQILFQSVRTGYKEIHVRKADGAVVQVSSLRGALGGSPDWSPDGDTIVYDRNWTNEDPSLFLISLSSPTRRPVYTDPVVRARGASWSRDGRWIYFIADLDDEIVLWKVSPEGGKPIQVTRTSGPPVTEPVDCCARESYDGEFVYFRRGDAIWKMPADGGVEERVFEAPLLHDSTFDIAEDGIYFISNRDPVERTFLEFYSFHSRNTSVICEIQEPNVGLSVTRDGRSILFSRVDQRERDLVMMHGFSF